FAARLASPDEGAQVENRTLGHLLNVERLWSETIRALFHLEQVERAIRHVEHAVSRLLDQRHRCVELRRKARFLANDLRERNDAGQRRSQVMSRDALDVVLEPYVFGQNRILLLEPFALLLASDRAHTHSKAADRR